MPQLPEAFCTRMQKQLGDEFPDFMLAMRLPAVRGIRMNPAKPCPQFRESVTGDVIPWAAESIYMQSGSAAGSTIFHDAGAYYIQDPSAMIPAAVLDAKPGERILDLCSAPGGKATQIGAAMASKGLLVCNEPIGKRAAVLSGNIERMGIRNALVVSAYPDQLAGNWPEGFDAVLADVPCSGEGMFRRDPEAAQEWSAEKAAGCTQRQREILLQAQALVRPGGRMVYSTCTWNPAENEKNIAWFLEKCAGWETVPFRLSGIDAPDGMYTCFPHRLRGEGQFTALLRKKGGRCTVLSPDRSLKQAPKEETRRMREQFPLLPEPTHMLRNTLISMDLLPDIRGIRVLRAGLHLGEFRGSIFIPDHAAADYAMRAGMQCSPVSAEDALRYMAGEAVHGQEKGWTVVRYAGLALGWGKGTDGIIKNHYPKGLRNSRLIIG